MKKPSMPVFFGASFVPAASGYWFRCETASALDEDLLTNNLGGADITICFPVVGWGEWSGNPFRPLFAAADGLHYTDVPGEIFLMSPHTLTMEFDGKGTGVDVARYEPMGKVEGVTFYRAVDKDGEFITGF